MGSRRDLSGYLTLHCCTLRGGLSLRFWLAVGIDETLRRELADVGVNIWLFMLMLTEMGWVVRVLLRK